MSWLGGRSNPAGILSGGLVAGLKVLLPVATVDTVIIPLLPSNNPSDHPSSRGATVSRLIDYIIWRYLLESHQS